MFMIYFFLRAAFCNASPPPPKSVSSCPSWRTGRPSLSKVLGAKGCRARWPPSDPFGAHQPSTRPAPGV
eukprot:scaffold235984_cov31-Tisochrysis_lutea.AAC.2